MASVQRQSANGSRGEGRPSCPSSFMSSCRTSRGSAFGKIEVDGVGRGLEIGRGVGPQGQALAPGRDADQPRGGPLVPRAPVGPVGNGGRGPEARQSAQCEQSKDLRHRLLSFPAAPVAEGRFLEREALEEREAQPGRRYNRPYRTQAKVTEKPSRSPTDPATRRSKRRVSRRSEAQAEGEVQLAVPLGERGDEDRLQVRHEAEAGAPAVDPAAEAQADGGPDDRAAVEEDGADADREGPVEGKVLGVRQEARPKAAAEDEVRGRRPRPAGPPAARSRCGRKRSCRSPRGRGRPLPGAERLSPSSWVEKARYGAEKTGVPVSWAAAEAPRARVAATAREASVVCLMHSGLPETGSRRRDGAHGG